MNEAEEVKKRLDIVEFISQYLQLKKVGINYSANCPFHQEKTPSFMVSPERQSFKCFGCGESGDVISFYQKIEMLSFPEALKLLGERTGIDVSFSKSKEQYNKEKSKKSTIYKVNLLAAKYFKLKLQSKEGEQALDYLKSRKISEENIEKFKIGYAPPGDGLKIALNKAGCSYNDLSLAGNPERFRYRLMFPIFDTIGNVVGFSGRILEQILPDGVSPHPKYLNTPETAVFHKSRALYGISLAKEAIRKSKRVVIVEGQMDVISSHEAGVEEVTATSGTAITADHLRVLSRYTPNVIFAFDEDEAGRKAARTAIKMALEMELEPRLTTIDAYKDVGELVEADKSKWPGIVDKALPPIEWLTNKHKGKKLSAKDKKEIAKEAMTYISVMKDEIEKSHYIVFLSKFLSVPEISIEKALNKFESKKSNKKAKSEDKSDVIKDNLPLRYLSFLVNFPKLVPDKSPKQIEFDEGSLNTIYNQVQKCYSTKKDLEKSLSEKKASFDRSIAEDVESESIRWDEAINEDKDMAIEEFIDIEENLTRGKKEKIKNDFAQRIAEAESGGDLQEVKKLMKQLQKELKDIN